MSSALAKRYYAIGEVSELCGVKAHVLRYWEQEFPQLKPSKRRGNRRYYQVGDVETVRAIQCLLYEQGYTIQGAKAKLKEQRGSQTELQLLPAHSQPVLPPVNPLVPLRQELESLLALMAKL